MLSKQIKSLITCCNYLKKELKHQSEDSENIIKESERIAAANEKAMSKELDNAYDTIQKLYETNLDLLEQLKKYKRKSKLNSKNSNIPTSSEPFKTTCNSRTKSDKKVGGQKGHKRHETKLHKDVDKVVTKFVKQPPRAAIPVYSDVNKIMYYITQEVDMVLEARITETRYFIDENKEELDEQEMKEYQISPLKYADHFKAIVLYLNSKGVIAYKRLCNILNELSDNKINISEGSIVNWIKEFENQSKETRENILNEILSQPCIHADETGNPIGGNLEWLQVMANDKGTLYYSTDIRGYDENGILPLLQEYTGCVVHDHFKPYYTYLENSEHAECNAHILRELLASIELDNNVASAKLHKLMQTMIHERNELVRAGKTEMEVSVIETYESEYQDIIETELERYQKENPNIEKKYEQQHIKLFRRMLEYKENHLLFLHDFRIPCTNNFGEQQIRGFKIKRKVSGMVSKNMEMAESIAALWSVVQTCNIKDIRVLKTLEEIFKDENYLLSK